MVMARGYTFLRLVSRRNRWTKLVVRRVDGNKRDSTTAELSEMLTGSKTAYTPMATTQSSVDLTNETATPLDSAESSIPATPANEIDDSGVINDMEALDISLTDPSTSTDAPPVLSTRFRSPAPTHHKNSAAGPSHVPLPRDAYPEIHVPQWDPSDVPQDLMIDPFEKSAEQLDVPSHPLFVIDQLGVDRRMVSHLLVTNETADRPNMGTPTRRW